LILAEASVEAGYERAVKLKEQVASLQVRHRGETLRRITVSVGVAGFPQHGASAAHLVKSADEALYRAKAEGRDLAGATSTETPSECVSSST
jgi:two-component system cell cycle response regulator